MEILNHCNIVIIHTISRFWAKNTSILLNEWTLENCPVCTLCVISFTINPRMHISFNVIHLNCFNGKVFLIYYIKFLQACSSNSSMCLNLVVRIWIHSDEQIYHGCWYCWTICNSWQFHIFLPQCTLLTWFLTALN